ncbi:galactose-specific lectin nattectin-like [Misgurnus anguillicaudatus]|uniref:galactose-specific lectin nattectin-like n=1 Tax=Misgurnus anguillicaudatus TaxID=75329 RepID=UPI003CCF4E01
MAVMRALVFLFLVFSVENAAAELCPRGWKRFGVQCYKYFSHAVTWVTAEKNCQSVGANLASVHNTAENNFLLRQLASANKKVWIGGHDGETDGQWLWSDGSQFHFSNWCPEQPDNFFRIFPENCLEINYSSKNESSHYCFYLQS